MDTEEMYERGVADAERGELHPFYYQHYYHYRRGYDRTRWRMRGSFILTAGRAGRSWVLLATILAAVVGLGAYMLWKPRAQPSTVAYAQPTSPVILAANATPSNQPAMPTPTAIPTQPAGLRIGGMAQVVNTGGRVLRGRRDPGLNAPAVAAFKEGEQVRIIEGPVDADGYIWWRIEGPSGSGWSAQQSLEGVVWLQPVVE